MNNKPWIALGLVIVLLLAFSVVIPVTASPQSYQAYYYTPTAREDGRIIYIVKEGDTCISISLMNNIDEDVLRLNNNLTGDDCINLQANQELLLGIITPQPSPTPSLTPTGPTPTVMAGYGNICVNLFDDVDGNATAGDTEVAIAGGQVSVSNPSGSVSLTGETSADIATPLCFEDLAEGEYYISVAIPDGYNATNDPNYILQLNAGEVSVIDFGAQVTSSINTTTGGDGGGNEPLLAIIGILCVLAGLGVGVYWFRLSRSRR